MFLSILVLIFFASAAVASPFCPIPQKQMGCSEPPPQFDIPYPFNIQASSRLDNRLFPVGVRDNNMYAPVLFGYKATFRLTNGSLQILDPPATDSPEDLNQVGFSPILAFPPRAAVVPSNSERNIKIRAVFRCIGDRLETTLEADTSVGVNFSGLGFDQDVPLFLEPRGPQFPLKLEVLQSKFGY
ncbi:MAG: hypothetical protein M1829_005502 [Trizodia sp. TS-e1964]|nr:MAG: hypothetical protein M1829_005502 [Trizodia sp. TS-e1964]